MLNAVIAVSALWRVCSLLIDEQGPAHIFQRLREYAGIEYGHDIHGQLVKDSVPDTYTAQLLDCYWCLSLALAIPYTLLWLVVPNVTKWLSVPLAISAGVIGLNRLLPYNNHGTR